MSPNLVGSNNTEDTINNGTVDNSYRFDTDDSSTGLGSSHLADCLPDGSSITSGDVESGIGGRERGKDVHDTFGKNEEQAVKKARCIVVFAVIACAIAVSVSVYFFAKESDQRSFELEYEGFVKDIRSLVRWEVRYNFALMEQLSASITMAAALRGSSFPLHTDPQYEITGGFVDGMGGIMSAAFAPLVQAEAREEWEEYAIQNQGWIERSAYLKEVHPIHRDALHGTIQDHEHDRRQLQAANSTISPVIYRWENGEKVTEASEPGKVFAPLWQLSPADAGAVNVNLLSDPRVADLYDVMLKLNGSILSHNTEIGDLFDFLFDTEEKLLKKDPHGFILEPVYSEIEENPTLIGIAIAVTPFGNLLDRLLPDDVDGILGVFKDNCGNEMSFELSSGKAVFLGYEDLHEAEMGKYVRTEVNIEMYEEIFDGLCAHDLHLYPTKKLRASYDTRDAGIYTAIVAMAFSLTAALLMVYDHMVTRRQDKTMRTPLRTRAIVTSLFPERIARKLVKEAQESENDKKPNQNKQRFEGFMSDRGEVNSSEVMKASKPLADLFPEATIMFGDLVGFTAWSSLREPHQVFTLLETIYASFDTIATRRRVFKVETVGDCYVAVCGLPNPRKDHYTVMARFATECCHKVADVLNQLAIELGPDTAELGIRIGLHSGPVTAGVLRGDRARFQLFGDSVNTTARIEATGAKNKIHISRETANRLIAAGKEHWVTLREDKVVAKGKGELQTYWLKLKNDAAMSAHSGGETASTSTSTSPHVIAENDPDSKQPELQKGQTVVSVPSLRHTRVVDWNVDLLQGLLKNIAAHRQAVGITPDKANRMKAAEKNLQKADHIILEEVQDVIMLPKYDARAAQLQTGIDYGKLDPLVISQLHLYVHSIASLYCDNSFHNFEHASHVTMSCTKLLSRIVGPELDETAEDDATKLLHDHTYGITSDPLTQFSVILSALIHDVDHSGVPNAQLIKENHILSTLFKNKSVAEQNSVDIGWALLMEDSFANLRGAIYSNEQELKRFRQLVVNAVMATDVMDMELGLQRKARWNKAFSDEIAMKGPQPITEEDTNRKATIVIEHLIQAADVAHTMQHWHVYKKWNTCLFEEMYRAYKEGRSEKDPSESWYDGELGFFDFYIIPLAKKLKNCGVFGVSSEECLSYAQQNRNEWESKGKAVVVELVEKMSKEYPK